MAETNPIPHDDQNPQPHWFVWSFLLIVLLTFLAAVFLVLIPWRAEYWALRTEWAAEKADWSSVLDASASALRWKGSQPSVEVLRLRALFERDNSVADQFVPPSGALSPQANLAVVEILQSRGMWDQLTPFIDQLVIDLPREPRTVLIAARQALHEERTRDAIEWANTLVKVSPNAPSTHLLAGKVRLREGGLFSILKSVRHLFIAAESPDRTGLEAINLLLTLSQQTVFAPLEFNRLADLIQKHPESDPTQYLIALSIRTELNPDQKGQFIAQAVQRYEKNEPLLLARWLQTRGEFSRTISLIEAIEADRFSIEDRRELVRLQLRAFLQNDQQAEAVELLKASPSLDTAEAEYLRTVLAARSSGFDQDFIDQAELSLQAIRANPDPALSYALGRLCQNGQQHQLAIDAFSLSIEKGATGPIRLQAIQNKLNSLILDHQLEEALAFSSGLVEEMQDFPIFLNNYAYVALTLGQNTEAATEMIDSVVERFPNLKVLHGTQAFSRVVTGNFEEALEIFSKIPATIVEQVPATRLLGAFIQFNLGNYEEARSLHEKVDVNRLLPPEQKIFLQLAADLDSGTTSANN